MALMIKNIEDRSAAEIKDIRGEIYRTVFEQTIDDDTMLTINNDFKVGDVIDVSCENLEPMNIHIHYETPIGEFRDDYVITSGNGIRYLGTIVVEEGCAEIAFDAGWNVHITRNVIDEKADITKLLGQKADKSYVVSIFEQLKQLIQNGEMDSAVAILDEAILDLSTLA